MSDETEVTDKMVDGYRGTEYMFGPKPELKKTYTPSYTSRHGGHQDFSRDMKNNQQSAG